MRMILSCLLAALALAGCRDVEPDAALGTVEWDRVELVATAAEPITALAVREGDTVAQGQLVFEQRADRAEAELAAAAAELERTRQWLAEQQAGARPEQKREAAARVERARAALKLAEAEQARGLGLKARGLVSAAELDRLGGAAELARAELAAARASQDLLNAGTRSEALAQTRAAVTAAEQRLDALRITRERLRQRAPVAGRVESLPLDIGDTPTTGATVATLLVGAQPHARVYLSPTQRARARIGSRYAVRVHGREAALNARVRMLAAEAGFTPYYALSGNDANRLAYLAELEFEAGSAVDLAAGLPVEATPQP